MPEINNTQQTNGTEKSLVVWKAYLLKATCMNIDISPSQKMDNLACAKPNIISSSDMKSKF